MLLLSHTDSDLVLSQYLYIVFAIILETPDPVRMTVE
jgi:hypothetical protein